MVEENRERIGRKSSIQESNIGAPIEREPTLHGAQSVPKSSQSGGGGGGMANKSPEELRKEAKERVAKATAAVAGSLEGYAQQAEPKVVGEATRKAGEIVRETASTLKEEVQGARQEGLLPSQAEIERQKRMEAQQPGMMEKTKETLTQKGQDLKQRAQQTMEQTKQQMQQKSPEEIRAQMRQQVGGATARATGSMEGFTEQADPNLARKATHKAAETVKEAGKAIKEETQKTKQEMQGGGGGS